MAGMARMARNASADASADATLESANNDRRDFGEGREAEEVEGLAAGRENQGWAKSRACYVTCATTSATNGIMYAFPMLTPKLLNAGLSSSEVVIAGVLIQLGFGLVAFPFGHVYSNSVFSLGPAAMDRAMNILACSLMIVCLLIMIAATARAEETGDAVNAQLLSFAFMMMGCALGLSQFHSLSLVNFIFAADKAQRRMAVASMAFALGIGAVIYTLIYHYALIYLSLMYNFVVLLGGYLVLTGFRIKYMVRGRFEEPPSLELPQLPSILRSGSTSSASSTTSRLSSVFPGDSLANQSHQAHTVSAAAATASAHSPAESISTSFAYDESNSGDSSGREEHNTEGYNVNSSTRSRPIVASAQRAPTFHDYVSSRIVWLTSVSTFFGFGVGSTYLSSLGNLAGTLVEGEVQVELVTYYLTLAFLCFIILSRLITTIIYAHLNWPYVMTVWNVLLFVGILVYTAKPTLIGAYMSASLVGLGFGGLSSSPAVICTSNFPGSIAYYGMNLAVTTTVMRVGPFLIGYLETVIYEKSSLAGFNDEDFENFSTFIYFLCGSFVSTACSFLLGREIQKDHLADLVEVSEGDTHSQPEDSIFGEASRNDESRSHGSSSSPPSLPRRILQIT